jgi:hypothetical protein
MSIGRVVVAGLNHLITTLGCVIVNFSYIGQMGHQMTRKPTKKVAKGSAPKKQRPKVRPPIKRGRKLQATAGSPAKRKSRTYPRAIQHMRVTAGQSQGRPVMGMLQSTTMTHAGSTAHFDVSYLSRLGQKGANLAQAILQTCEKDYASLQQFFGGLTPHNLPFVVQVTSDSTGASHSSCLGTDIMVGGNSDGDVDFIRSLLVAEADEVFMANFGHGWDCGASPGEGLSRVLANDLYKGVEPADFISSDVWLNLNPRPNFVNTADPTDTNYNSIGCSVLFLNWLRFQLNHSWTDIIAGGGATLAGTYNKLTGKTTAWTDFTAVINAHFPPGQTYNLNTDNPFPL